MHLFRSEDRTCFGVDVHPIGCAVAIDLKDHCKRGRKRRLRRLEPDVFSGLLASSRIRGSGPLQDIRKILPDRSVRQTYPQRRVVPARVGILKQGEVLVVGNDT
jgi:hypothetical protein